MRLLLDTHAFLWFVLNDPLLSPKARLIASFCRDWLSLHSIPP
jgi:PIN domain nuclease of toxin-antitoxin system